MPGANEIRHHIAAVEQTKKITGAMEMVSSNRMRKVMGHIEQNHHYFEYVRKTMKELRLSSRDISHPYLNKKSGSHRTYVVISGDKGMCGAYNSTVLNYAMERIEQSPGCSLITIGNTSEDFFHARGIIPDITLLGIAQDPTLPKARETARELMQLFESELTDEIHLIFTAFYDEMKNKPVDYMLLPILPHNFDDVSGTEKLSEIICHPSAQKLFDMLVPQYVIGIIFGVMVQAYASEHFARMNAMRSATTNAQDMLKNLRIRYNLARQSAITNEIAEITGAAEILKEDTHYAGE